MTSKGLCHQCLTANVKVITHKGQIICMDCYHKKFKPSPENSPPPTLNDLKNKLERNYE